MPYEYLHFILKSIWWMLQRSRWGRTLFTDASLVCTLTHLASFLEYFRFLQPNKACPYLHLDNMALFPVSRCHCPCFLAKRATCDTARDVHHKRDNGCSLRRGSPGLCTSAGPYRPLSQCILRRTRQLLSLKKRPSVSGRWKTSIRNHSCHVIRNICLHLGIRNVCLV